MKFVKADPNLIEQAQIWANANPTEAVIGGIVAFAAFCYGNAIKDALGG